MNPISSYIPNQPSSLNNTLITYRQQNADSGERHNSKLPNDFYDIAKKFDVKSINIDETIAMSQELYDKGHIELKEHMVLSFDTRNLGDGRTNKGSQVRTNLIDEYKARIEENKRLNETQNMQNNNMVLSILVKLDALKTTKPIDIIV